MIDFPSGQLSKILSELEQGSFNGMAEITVETAILKQTFSKIIIFRQGKIVFAYSKLVTPQELAKNLGRKLNISIISAAIKTAETKVTNPDSFQETFAFLARMKVIQPQQIEAFILQDIILTLEQLLSYGGGLKTNSQVEFDLAYGQQETGWSFTELIPQLTEREKQWQKFARVGITSAEAVPKVRPEVVRKISSISVQKHCRDWIDGKQSIKNIAGKLHEDPLKLANRYYNWANQKWIYFGEKPPANESEKSVALDTPEPKVILPTVLSVDDSPVVQTMLKRALQDRYNVLLATNGMEALKILNSGKEEIKLVLLDVTMPDIDGIELCRTIRRFKKFQNLPIIMLTAKDGMFDKVKGKFAGSTEYLTKPIDKKTLLTAVGQYVPSLATTK